MSNIILPERFEKKLRENQQLNGIVNTVLFQFGEILEDNKLYFFEEYTDHGIKHIENVILSSNHLITKLTFERILTEKDIAYYLLAVILHDIGMHIRLEGFKLLISGEYDDIHDRQFDSQSWQELWRDYLAEAKRFDQRQLLAIFGTKEIDILEPDLEKPELLTGYDRKLIGEFIRRHHPRLAHEIALKGFPGKQIQPFCDGLLIKERNLIGLVARSHGGDLRACADHVERLFGPNGNLVPLGIHAIYHMVLLRIGDYIQIDKSRTSITLLKLRSFTSPVSINEHSAHLAIDSIDDKYQHDPERIFVMASPLDSAMFFKLKRLFSSIQFELDRSWAVLGELYGGHEDRPEIRFRRLHSNLEEVNYQSKLPYVPQLLSFKGNDELIKLLIAPLYGDDPSYGVRELLQNAVDACREREHIDKNIMYYEPAINIVVSNNDGQMVFTITDNGIGMDVTVIKDFFLNAGASFRNSQAWNKNFLNEGGESTVRRSGRFGIGALAAFLIGKEIEVTTRKFDQEIGYRFKATIDSENIELIKDAKLPVGTMIQIQLTKEVYVKMIPASKAKSHIPKWHQWYTLDKPKVTYKFDATTFEVEQPNPDITENLPATWHSIFPAGYTGLLWTYDTHANTSKFTCNGINIPQDPGTNGLRLGLVPHLPKISIFDNSGTLPLTLSRNGFSAKLSFNQDLENDISKDLIAYLLTVNIRSVVSSDHVQLVKQQLNYPGLLNKFTHDGFSYGPLAYLNNSAFALPKYPLLGKGGYLFDYAFCVKSIKGLKGLYLHTRQANLDLEQFDIQNHFIKFSAYALKTIPDYKAVIEPKQHSTLAAPAMILLKRHDYEYYFEDATRRLNTSFKKSATKFHDNGNWIGLNLNLGRETVVKKSWLDRYGEDLDLIRDYDIKTNAPGHDILNALLLKYLGKDMVIPYNIEERIKKFPLAFSELQPYMVKYL